MLLNVFFLNSIHWYNIISDLYYFTSYKYYTYKSVRFIRYTIVKYPFTFRHFSTKSNTELKRIHNSPTKQLCKYLIYQ